MKTVPDSFTTERRRDGVDAPNDTGQDVRPKEKETFAAYIQIVGPVFYNRKFSDKAKLLYGLLAAMTQAPRYYAFARNSTLMKFLCCSERTLQRCLSELEDAGELSIENGSGGRTIRKIRLTRLQPIYPDKNDGVNPDKNDGGNKNNRKENKQRGKAPVVSQDDVIQWFNNWVVKLNLSEKDSLALCTDLRDLAESREALGKPFKTIKAAARMANRLEALTKDDPHPVALMRYLLGKAIRNNWQDIYGLDDEDVGDYAKFLWSEYSIMLRIGTDADDYF
jgi:hypothetical protein